MSRILVLNSGSSSVKYRLYAWDEAVVVLAAGSIERVGLSDGPADHRAAFGQILARLGSQTLSAIGHRVVHGGEAFATAVRVTPEVIAAIRAASPLAPLHNPTNLLGIELCQELWPNVPQVAVFDTAFHQSLPPEGYRYALPEDCYRLLGVRRYGFHGISLSHLVPTAAAHLGQPSATLKLIALHLGNGASITAIDQGQSIDTSMGMTPLAGLVMGSRCGDLDPGVLLYLLANGYTSEALAELLNHASGFKGVAGSSDLRDVLARAEAGDAPAQLALALYVRSLKKYIGAYLALLGWVDALIFTGGIGEHGVSIRHSVCAGLEPLGIALDPEANVRAASGVREIQSPTSRCAILVIPADEEGEIARQTAGLLG